MTTIIVPKEYGYVLALTATTFFIGSWHGMRIGSFRKAAGIPYPKAYAESGDIAAATPEKKHAMYLFNCAQRAHYNWLENHTSAAMAMLMAGVEYPLTTTALGAGWLLGRMIYAIGYTRTDRSDGKGRLSGSFFWLFQFGLFGLAGWIGVKMVM